MSSLARDLGVWFWRLVPANPILLRVVHAGGRRYPHLLIRTGYLIALTLVVVGGVIFAHSGEATSLADLAKRATQVFDWLSHLQLLLVCVLAPLFTAAAITQEKDSQTFSILLSTPLTNGQIVLGSLFSRLFFIFVLLLAGIPLFCVMMVYGGVTGDRIAESMAIAGGTALLTGSLAITISFIKVGTGRTIFFFYLAIAVYLIVIYSLASWTGLIPPEAVPSPRTGDTMSWLAAFHPFLSLAAVLGRTPAPEYGAVAHYGFPGSYLLAYPHHCYLVMTISLSLLLIFLSLFFVRRGAKQGEPTLFTRLFGHRGPESETTDLSRKPRYVGRNPIAWREAVTSASAGGGPVMRYSILGTGLVIALVFLIYYLLGTLTTAEMRLWLYGLVAVELGITLFVATTTAATSMTREKESNTLELVLATPITSARIIQGKIWGLVHAAGPMLLVPWLTIGLFVLFDLLTGRMFKPGGGVVHWEALLTLPVMMICFTAVACMVGLQCSIKSKKTIGAVFTSMGIVVAVVALTAGCVLTMRNGVGNATVNAALMPLAPFTAVYVIVDPQSAVSSANVLVTAADVNTCRVIAFFASFCSALVYGLIGYALHRSMVRSFDMIIRKQTA